MTHMDHDVKQVLLDTKELNDIVTRLAQSITNEKAFDPFHIKGISYLYIRPYEKDRITS